MDASTQELLFVSDEAIRLRTAAAATELDAKLNIALVAKVYPLHSHAMSAERCARAGTRGIEFLG